MENKIKFMAFSCAFCFLGCENYLAAPPDKQLMLPITPQSTQALLNNTAIMNIGYTYIPVVASDNFYLQHEDWLAGRSNTDRNAYAWNVDESHYDFDRNDWTLPYITVYNCNVVLDALENEGMKAGNHREVEDLRGQALFYRSFAYFNLLQVFSKRWTDDSAGNDMGVVLRLNSNFNLPSDLSSLKDCYEQIVSDLNEASTLLFETSPVVTRPNVGAAHALLARIYLSMGNYREAKVEAETALSYNHTLISYADLDVTAPFPIARFNEEVIFHSCIAASWILMSPQAKIDSSLVNMYGESDLRKDIFFLENSDGSFGFRGSYDGSTTLFNGLTTSEIILILAESEAREGNNGQARNHLGRLLENRLVNPSDILGQAGNEDTIENTLELILNERRKELVFRGLRWMDLRRLSGNDGLPAVLERNIDGTVYRLDFKSGNYVFSIPDVVVQRSGIY